MVTGCMVKYVTIPYFFAIIFILSARYLERCLIGWLVVLGLTALRESISVYIGPSPTEREKEERKVR